MSTFVSRSLLTVCLLLASAPLASAAMVDATLKLQLGGSPPATIPAATLVGSGQGSSAGFGGAATLQAGVVSGIAIEQLDFPLTTLLDGFAIGAAGIAGPVTAPASNQALAFDGVTGTMGLNASAYLLMGGSAVAEIPLAVVGTGGTQMFHFLSIVTGTVNANPYQLGMVTVMGQLNGGTHTVSGTGFDGRTPAGNGTLVLVSPTVVEMGSFGTWAMLTTLTLEIPEPGALALLGIGVAGLAAVSRPWR